MHTMNQQKIAYTIPAESENGDDIPDEASGGVPD